MSQERLLLAALLAIFYSYFFHGGGWNANARYAQIFQVVEHATVEITPYAGITGDVAIYKGKLYPNKTLGSTILGTPVYVTLYGLEFLMGAGPFWNTQQGVLINAYLINLFSNAFLTVVSLCVFSFLLSLEKHPPFFALFLPLTLGLGTLLFPYSTIFMGHTQAAAMLLLGSACLYIHLHHIKDPRLVWLAGLFMGIAIITDLFTIYYVAIFTIWILAKKDSHMRDKALFLCGLSIPLLIMAIYQHMVFENALSLPMSFNNPIFKYSREDLYLGVFQEIKTVILIELIMGLHYGFFIFNPVCLISIMQLIWDTFSSKNSFFACVMLGTLISFISNTAFIGWWGGSSIGPRYLIPVIVMVGYGMLNIRTGKMMTFWLWGTFLSGFLINLAISCTTLMPGKLTSIFSKVLPDFLSLNWMHSQGQIKPHHLLHAVTEEKQFISFNLGQLMQIPHPWTLVPLCLSVGILMCVHYTAKKLRKPVT